MKALYTAVATARGGREGHARSSDGVLDIDLRTPREMGGAGGHGTNPEQLFAAGYAACFESALRLVARKQGKPVDAASITAHVTLGLADAGKYTLAVQLHGTIAGSSTSDTLALMRAAHEVCPYSNATRGNIEVELIAE